MPHQNDTKLIRRCFELAAKGAGAVSPNPLVGAVLVKDGHVIGQGWHQRFGGPHAEVNAIDSAIEPVEGATLYVNLEPCSHFDKKTPPCAQRVIKEKIKRVVVSNRDPNPKVNGKGLQLLREAGIEVVEGILQKEGARLNRFFFKYVKTGLPWVTVKIAQTKDGFIARQRGEQTWITGPEAQKEVHRMRAHYDAVLVGAGTVLADDPQLTVRAVNGRNPVRVVIDGKLTAPASRKIFTDGLAKTIVCCGTVAPAEKKERIQSSGCLLITNEEMEKRLDLPWVLKSLAEHGINSILVEGGQQIFTQCISQHLADEIIVFESRDSWSKGLPAFSAPLNWLSEFKSIADMQVGNDHMMRYIRK